MLTQDTDEEELRMLIAVGLAALTNPNLTDPIALAVVKEFVNEWRAELHEKWRTSTNHS